MKKILLVTMQDNNNIGNRLQNYALQKILEQYDAQVTNIDNGYMSYPSLGTLLKNQVKKYLGCLGSKKYATKYIEFHNTYLRYSTNYAFTRRYISDIQNVTYTNVFEKNWDSYDLAIVGSDQVWHNWGRSSRELSYYYLEFMPKEKRTSYAASFGFDEFPINDRKEHIKGLKGMRTISCREKSGCKLVKEATGKEATHVLDPTLLLKPEEWRNIEADISTVVKPEEKYIFIYFLGNIIEEYRQYIEGIASKRGCRIINFLDMQDENIVRCGVGEFVSFIDHADYVLTDSFHCTVFSILFEKEFTVFKRRQEGFEKMYSRIEELLQSTGHEYNAYDKLNPNPMVENFETLYENSRRYLTEILR